MICVCRTCISENLEKEFIKLSVTHLNGNGALERQMDYTITWTKAYGVGSNQTLSLSLTRTAGVLPVTPHILLVSVIVLYIDVND